MAADSDRVLVIEDDHDQARLMRAVLKYAGYEVDSVGDAVTAEAQYRSGSFDALVVDYYLPDGNGIELLDRLEKIGPLPAVVMCTASSDEEVKFRGERFGVAEVVRKDAPGRIVQELPSAVARSIDQSRQRRQDARERLAGLQSHVFAHSLFEDGVPRCLVDADLRITDVNSAFCEFFHVTREETVGTKCCEVTQVDGCDPEDCAAAQAIRENRTISRSRKGCAGSDDHRFMSVTAVPMPSESGAAASVMMSLVEVSNDALRQHLSQSEARLELFAQVANAFLALPGEEVYGEVLELILAKLHSRFGVFGYIDSDGNYVCPSLTRDAWSKCRMPDKRLVFERKDWRGVWGQTLLERRTIILNQPLSPPAGHVPISRFLGTPIVYREELIGAVLLANKEEDYTREDAAVLEDIARYIGPIVKARLDRDQQEARRARAEEELRVQSAELARGKRQLETLFALTRLVEQGHSRDDFLQKAVELIASAFSTGFPVRVRLSFEGQAFASDEFVDTQFVVASAIFVANEYVGAIEVGFEGPDNPLAMQHEMDKHRAFIRDIAERLSAILSWQSAAHEAQDVKQRMEMILSVTNTGMGIMDSDCRMVYVDQNRRRIYGDLHGKTSHQYFCDRDDACWSCAAARALKTKKTVVAEHTLPREGDRHVQTTAIPYQDEQGNWFVAEITVDITERKKMEFHLAQAQKLEAVGHLAAGIAHEINTPTQYVGDNVRFLQDTFQELNGLIDTLLRVVEAAKQGPPDPSLLDEAEATVADTDLEYLREEIPRAIHESLEGVDRVATIVHAMKEFSHPGSDEKQPVDINRVLDTTLAVSRNEWKYVAEVVTDFQQPLPSVPVLTAELNQALLNVIVNAAQAIGEKVKGSDQKGTITVTTRASDHRWIEIRIADTGTGIPQEARDKVFNPFFTTKGVGQGTGQGLSIVYGTVVEKHQGTIHFETEEGVGTTFIIRLPTDTCEKESHGTPASPLFDALTDDGAGQTADHDRDFQLTGPAGTP